MVKTKQNKTIIQDEVPTPVINLSEEQKVETTTTFVVTRGGARVSENEYSTPDAVRAIEEKEFWQNIVKRFPDGTRVEIVSFDKKKHRIW